MRVVAVLIMMALLGGCNNDAERRRAVAADQEAELLRITDPAHGADELRQRILQNLKLSGPHIVVWLDEMEARHPSLDALDGPLRSHFRAHHRLHNKPDRTVGRPRNTT